MIENVLHIYISLAFQGTCGRGRQLRFASRRYNYGVHSMGENPPRNSKTNDAGIKVGDRSPGVGAYARGRCYSQTLHSDQPSHITSLYDLLQWHFHFPRPQTNTVDMAKIAGLNQ
jgi:hypothetical protein